jgi:glycosyltransferase involved in cell wall biosynthesis
MAAGTPVATPSGGIVETMRDHETGFLVEKNDSHALAEAILKLVENDALGVSMEERPEGGHLSIFDWDTIVAAIYIAVKILAAERILRPTSPVLRGKHSPLRQGCSGQIPISIE